MKNKTIDFAKFLIGWPLSIASLYFIWQMFRQNSSAAVFDIQKLDITFLFIAIFCFIIFYFLRSSIWFRIIKNHSENITFKRSSYLWAMSEIKRYIPGKFWFILGRAVSFSDSKLKKRTITRLMITELQIFAISAALISLLSLPFLYKYFLGDQIQHQMLTYPVILLLFTGTAIFIFNRALFHKAPGKLKNFLSTILPESDPRETIMLIIISLVSLFFYGLANYFTALSFGFLEPRLILQLIGLFNLSFLIGFLSFLTPAGLGIREGASAVGLAKLIPASSAALISLFSRLILIVSELIFIALTIIWNKLNNHYFLKIEKFIGTHIHESIMVFLTLLYLLYFSLTSFLRYDNYFTGRFDLGNMVQTVWNTSNGRIFMFTNPDGTEIVSRLAFHADFILVLFAPLYALWPHPYSLLFIQTLFVAAGSIFIYLIALRVLRNKNLSLIFALSYLLNPALQRGNIYDFHAVTLVTFFLLGAFYFMIKKNYKLLILFLFFAAMTKEQIWLITALFGLTVFIFYKKRLLGFFITTISILMFYLLIWHAIPQAGNGVHFALSYYGEFGDSPASIITNTIINPQKTIQLILEPGRLDYLRQIFSPVGYLSFLAPWYLIFAGPDLAINLLSGNEQLHQIYYQYVAAINPFIFISAIYAIKYITRLTGLRAGFFIAYLLFFAIYGAYNYGPLPGSRSPNLDMFTRPHPDKKTIDQIISQIPQTASVAASNNIGSHLAHRELLFTIPLGVEEADYVIFLLTGGESDNRELEIIKKLEKDKRYEKIRDINNFLVFKKKN